MPLFSLRSKSECFESKILFSGSETQFYTCFWWGVQNEVCHEVQIREEMLQGYGVGTAPALINFSWNRYQDVCKGHELL